MADSQPKEEEKFTKLKMKKRKQRQDGEGEDEENEHRGPSKSSRAKSSLIKKENHRKTERNDSQKLIHFVLQSPWVNLHLILLLQNKDIDIPRKLEVAFDYVQFRMHKREDVNSRKVLEMVSISRVILFVNNWIQSILISSVKKMGDKEYDGQLETSGSYLDNRCWVILKFCLEESRKLNVLLSFSRDFLRVIDCIAKDTLTQLNSWSMDSMYSSLASERLEHQDTVLGCISLVFTCHGGIQNENLDLWIMVSEKVLELVQQVFTQKLDYNKAGVSALQFSCYLLEPFAKFLRAHPARKNGFHDFIDRLLEPLMSLLDELHHCASKNPVWREYLLKLVEEVLSQGIFHPIHMDGFLSLHSTIKFKISDDGKSNERPTVIKSYHRHLFEKLEKITACKTGLPLGGIGELLHLFADWVTKRKRISSIGEGPNGHIVERTSTNNATTVQKYDSSGSLNSETRKQLIDFFVQIMEHFISCINAYAEAEVNLGDPLLNVLSVFKSANKLLASFKKENKYVQLEDTYEGAFINFMRFIYQTVLSFSAKIKHPLLLSINSDNALQKELLLLITKEMVVAFHHIMDIGYEVVGDDLESLWVVILTFTACSRSAVDVSDQHFLNLEILHLGSRLIDLYSELRQVNNSIFALSKAVRRLASNLVDNEAFGNHFYSSYSNSLSGLICSAEFRFSISNAIKSIPEGQASGCIQLLTADISESLEWLKAQLLLDHSNNLSKLGCGDSSLSWLNLETELLARILAEVYTLVLDSMVVTVGNSIAVGRSVEKLVALMSYSSNGEDVVQPDIMERGFCMVSGRTHSQGAGFNNDFLLCWLLVFFFRLYSSCRSLYRETISLVPADISRKMSETMGDFHTAFAGKDWSDGSLQNDEGYFSWIMKPSTTLLSVIHNVSSICLQESLGSCPPMVYILNAISIQRLADLNGILSSFEYLLAKNDKLVSSTLVDDNEMSLSYKRSKKWRKRLSIIKQEAADLTKFIMSWFSSLIKDPILVSFNNGLCENLSVHNLHKENSWDLSVGSLNKKSLPSAIWWIVCQHVDIWCNHADKRDLKQFLTYLVRSGLSFGSAQMNRLGFPGNDELSPVQNVTMHLISLELLNDTCLYEQRSFCRLIVSRLCRNLEASLASSDFGKGYLNSQPDWSKVIHSLEIVSNGVSNGKHAKTLLMNLSPLKIEQLAPGKSNYSLCCSLLNFLAWMPKGVLSSKSLLQLITCILNVERVVVGDLLSRHQILLEAGHSDAFRLFLTCRRLLKVLFASCDEKMAQGHSSIMSTLSESSFPLLWLLKSLNAVMGIQTASSEDIASQGQDMLFTLMDHTSYVLMQIGKYQCELALQFLPGVVFDGKHNPATESKEDDAISSDNDLQRSLTLLNEILREHKKAFSSEKFRAVSELLELKKFSSIISCIQAFLCGFTYILDKRCAENDKNRVKISECNMEYLFKLKIFIEECTKSLIDCLRLLFLKGDVARSLEYGRSTDISGFNSMCSGETEYKIDAEVDDLGSDIINGVSDKYVGGKLHEENGHVESLLSNVESFDQNCLKKSLLEDLLRGENPEVAFFLKQLLLSASSIMRLKLELKDTSLLENLIPALFGISEVLLVKFKDMVAMPSPFSFMWLDGVGKFLMELGKCFRSSPMLSRKLYVKLIDLHLKSIGKCIVLEGKTAALASEGLESNIKDPIELFSITKLSLSSRTSHLDSFKARLRMSFRVLVQKSSALLLLSAIQAIERAIVGVQEDCLTNYELYAGNFDGGKATLTVAAGIDCLDLLIEFVTGHKRLKIVRRHMQGLVSCLFNVILHLQGPGIFFESVSCSGDYTSPDPGSMILMCVDILRRLPGKHALFEMDACHVGQFLNIPAALFQNLLQIELFEVLHTETTGTCSLKSTSGGILDRRYCLELYSACCRLLCSIVKHHPSEIQCCNALLQHSVSILLQCLEMVNINSAASRGNFAWEVEDGARCACSLRRVYEEIRQQKEFIGRYCHQFLSGYISVYCGFGPHKTGIIREVDEALKPGIYALIDACSPDDLQRLHTVFGEGPCRSTLATLQNDYKLHFKYEGKV